MQRRRNKFPKMTFLQPFILWGLPLVLVPVLIHLFNRLRHRSMPWAAMMFLRSATRKSTRYARLRQFLVLLFRVLAVLVLVLALSRPLAGGWVGWAFASAPDVVVILLDRSASMETKDPASQSTKRETAIGLLGEAARRLEESSRFVLLENAFRAPQEIGSAAALAELPLVAATDTAADFPEMLQAALDWFNQTRPGTAEIWIASDLQRSNWQPESERWPALSSGLAALPQGVRVRLLALNKEPAANTSVSVPEADRQGSGAQYELNLTVDVERSSPGITTLPLLVNLNEARSQVELKMESQSFRYRHRTPLGNDDSGGWGYVELPADANPADNRSYFVYGTVPALRAAVIGQDEVSRQILQAAIAPNPANTNQICEVIGAEQLETTNWDRYALVVWQAPLPTGELADRLQAFVEGGGVIVFFPPGEPGGTRRFGGIAWGEAQQGGTNGAFQVVRWEEQEGPLAKTDEGFSLPVSDLEVKQRQLISGELTSLASFGDEAVFLGRRVMAEGQVVVCSTLANAEWSDLADGAVLVPMMQRLLREGGRRFAAASSLACGDWTPSRDDERWAPVDSREPKDIRTRAGVYRSGTRMVAVNRPGREDDREILEAAKATELFGGLPVHLFEEESSRASRLQSELWRLFLFGMAIFLIAEGILILPERGERRAGQELGGGAGAEPIERQAEMAEVTK